MNRRSAQLKFAKPTLASKSEFGGALLKKRRFRVARPVSTKETMHLVLKSSIARGSLSFRMPFHRSKIAAIIRRSCTKFGVTLVRASNNSNHLHLHLKFGSRELYKRFVRSITGQIAMAVTGARKAKPISKLIGKKSFWDARPYTRIAHGRRGFKIVDEYVKLNQLEAEGIIPKRRERLRGVKPSERRCFETEGRRRARPSEELERRQLDFF